MIIEADSDSERNSDRYWTKELNNSCLKRLRSQKKWSLHIFSCLNLVLLQTSQTSSFVCKLQKVLPVGERVFWDEETTKVCCFLNNMVYVWYIYIADNYLWTINSWKSDHSHRSSWCCQVAPGNFERWFNSPVEQNQRVFQWTATNGSTWRWEIQQLLMINEYLKTRFCQFSKLCWQSCLQPDGLWLVMLLWTG